MRQRGFTGILRASGPLFSDQFPQALACGFDEVEIPDANAARQPVEQWLAARDRITLAYQRGYGAGENILERRRAPTRRNTKMSEDLRALADELDAAFARADLPARLRLLRDALKGRVVFTTSFGIEDQALTDAIRSQDLDVEFSTLDTGRHVPGDL